MRPYISTINISRWTCCASSEKLHLYKTTNVLLLVLYATNHGVEPAARPLISYYQKSYIYPHITNICYHICPHITTICYICPHISTKWYYTHLSMHFPLFLAFSLFLFAISLCLFWVGVVTRFFTPLQAYYMVLDASIHAPSATCSCLKTLLRFKKLCLFGCALGERRLLENSACFSLCAPILRHQFLVPSLQEVCT